MTHPFASHPESVVTDPAVPPLGLRAQAADWRDLRGDWEARLASLADNASQPNPFFEPWHLFPSLEALDRDHRVRIWWLADHEGGIAGMIPLQRQTRYYGRPIPHWRNWMHANCFLGVPLVRRGYEMPFWHALLEWADDAAAIPIFLHLAGIPLETELSDALERVLAQSSRKAQKVHIAERALLSSSLSPEDYLADVLSTGRRKELRRQRRRLEELGTVTAEYERGEDGIECWIADFLALEAAGWKGTCGTAAAQDPAKIAIFQAALRGAARCGKLERRSLSLDHRPIAMLASFRTPPGAFSYKTTYAEEYARYSPGVLLQVENLDSLCDPAIDWVDSCASEDHPMIDRIWRDRRAIARYSIGIGGTLRQSVFGAILAAEGGAA